MSNDAVDNSSGSSDAKSGRFSLLRWFEKSLPGSSGSAIGLDLGTSYVRAIQLSKSSSGYSVISGVERDLPLGSAKSQTELRNAQIRAVHEVLEAGAFRGNSVIACLPESIVQYVNLRMPKLSAKEMSQAVRWEVSSRLNIDPTEAEIRYITAGDVPQGHEVRSEVITMAVTARELEAYIYMFDECDIALEAIETAPTCIARTVARLDQIHGNDDMVNAVVDIGQTNSKVIVMQGDRVLFYKSLELGGQHIDQAVADHLEIPLGEAVGMRRNMILAASGRGASEELPIPSRPGLLRPAVLDGTRAITQKLAKEIMLCLRYCSVTFRGLKPDAIVLTGGEANEQSICRMLAESLEIDVNISVARALDEIDKTGMLVQIGPGERGFLPEWSTAVGLALRG